MTSRRTAFALTLLLFSASAFAGPAPCCSPSDSADKTMIAMDCCASMVECPTRLQAPATIVIRSADSPPAAGILWAGAAGSLGPAADPRRPVASHGSLDNSPDKPPLYRLHSQLLI